MQDTIDSEMLGNESNELCKKWKTMTTPGKITWPFKKCVSEYIKYKDVFCAQLRSAVWDIIDKSMTNKWHNQLDVWNET